MNLRELRMRIRELRDQPLPPHEAAYRAAMDEILRALEDIEVEGEDDVFAVCADCDDPRECNRLGVCQKE